MLRKPIRPPIGNESHLVAVVSDDEEEVLALADGSATLELLPSLRQERMRDPEPLAHVGPTNSLPAL
jgi:hypothetical protein